MRPAASIAYYLCSQPLSVSLHNTHIMLGLSSLYRFKLCSDLAITRRWVPRHSDFNSTLYFIITVQVHVKRCGWTYTVSWLWNLKNGLLLAGPNSFKALTQFIPMSETLVTTSSPTLRCQECHSTAHVSQHLQSCKWNRKPLAASTFHTDHGLCLSCKLSNVWCCSNQGSPHTHNPSNYITELCCACSTQKSLWGQWVTSWLIIFT